MKLAMYKGPPDTFWLKLRATGAPFKTGPAYSHVELVFGGPDAKDKYQCASSSAWDDGVRFKWIALNSGRWDVFTLFGYHQTTEMRAFQWFVEHAGKPYDHLSLAWLVMPIRKFTDPGSYTCSEAIASAFGLPKPHRFQPQSLLEHLAPEIHSTI